MKRIIIETLNLSVIIMRLFAIIAIIGIVTVPAAAILVKAAVKYFIFFWNLI